MSTEELTVVTNVLALDEQALVGLAGTVALQQGYFTEKAKKGYPNYLAEIEAYAGGMRARLRVIETNLTRCHSVATRLADAELLTRVVGMQTRRASAESGLNAMHQRCLFLHYQATLNNKKASVAA